MTAIDGKLMEAELDAYREIVSWIIGKPISDQDFGAHLERVSETIDKAGIERRVRELAPAVAPELRELTFKIVMALALVDNEAADDEDALMGILFEHLGLSEDRAEAIAAEVRGAFA
jgi:hypothetical protein